MDTGMFLRVILVYLSNIVVVSGGKICPDACVCQANEGVIRVDCTGTEITKIPAPLPLNVTELRITNANISVLRSRQLSGFVYLSSLTISGSRVHTIEQGVFEGLDSLKRLDLHGNELSECGGVFAGLANLTTLYLYGNKFTQIKSSCFSDTTDLARIFLNNNSISSIDDQAFSALLRLQTLNLNWNSLTELNDKLFVGLTHLKYLMLAHNQIKVIHPDTFADSPDIAYLWLSFNKISSLPPNLCSRFKALYYLSLSSNLLSEIPSTVWRNRTHLQSLVLKDNPFTRIQADAFSGLSSLMYLVIDTCPNLAQIEEHAFRGLGNLVTLSIEHNINLRTIDAKPFSSKSLVNLTNLYIRNNSVAHFDKELFEQFPKLHTARIEMNPLNCSCGLKWMREVMDVQTTYWARDWSRDPHKPTCSSPANLDGYAVSALYRDDLTCDPPRLEAANENPWVERNGMAVFQASLSRGIPSTRWWCDVCGKWIYPKNSSSIDNDNIFAMETKSARSKVFASLTILNVTEKQLGNYTLEATNGGGVSYVEFTLSYVPPAQPTQRPDPSSTPNTQGTVIIFGVVGGLLAATIIIVGYLVLRKRTQRDFTRVPLFGHEMDDGYGRNENTATKARSSYGSVPT